VPWSQGRRLTVVGVLTATVEQDPRQGLCCQVWIPLDRDLSFVDVFLRCSGPPLSMTSALRKAIATAAPGAQLLRSGTLSGAIEATREAPRKAAWLLGFLALLALLLAGAGVYGVAAQLVLSRRQEFAIRLALGETPGGLARLVLGQTSRLALLGLSLGLLGSVWVGMVAKHLLLGVGNLDPLSWAGGGLLLLAAALLATLMPALRAARTQPAAALRSEEGRRHAGRSPGVARASPRWIKIGGRACPNDSRSRQ
jgi:predicted lysophospholipase L1 biosynthesis ABC-type transport system permease subunit